MSEPGAPLAPGQPGTVDGVGTPPSVWAECTRCGQRSHISATSCPSCGSPLSRDEGEATQAMPGVEDTAPPGAAAPAPAPALVAASAPPDGSTLIAGLVRDTRVSPRVAGSQTPLVETPRGEDRATPGPVRRWSALDGEHSPGVLIGAGVGLGLLLLLTVVLFTRLLGSGTPGAGTASPTSTASAISSATITATASSTQDPEGGITYSAENTLDGRAETAWNSDGRVDGKGPGMVLTYRFADPVELSAITVLNGYQKTLPNPGRTPSDLFALNSRVRSWRVTTDTGSWVWDLADDRAPQTLSKQFGTTSSVRFEVREVYPGSKYLDLAVSEVSFAGLG